MIGADAAAMRRTARQFRAASARLHDVSRSLGSRFFVVGWSGAEADRARRDWEGESAPALLRIVRFLDELAAEFERQAAEQQSASTVRDDRTGRLGFGSTVSVPDSGMYTVEDRRPVSFEAPVDGRAAVVTALEGLADPGRIAFDEIEIRSLTNGRFIVVLPGVTDLSDGVGEFVDGVRDRGLLGVDDAARDADRYWSSNDAPTVRKMRYAIDAATSDDSTVNPYAIATLRALEVAGVPAGAEVMLVGHSFGAYAAMDLAADPACYSDGFGRPSYQVDITHVVATGAETDWRLHELPVSTAALIVNNRLDVVYRTEDVLHRNAGPEHQRQVEKDFWGGRDGYGHDESNYVAWIRDATDHDDLRDWLDDAGTMYVSGGTRLSVPVPDPM